MGIFFLRPVTRFSGFRPTVRRHDRPSVILERTCSTAGNRHQDALFVQSSGRLIAAENKVPLFRIARS
jgi:hypothetical protein